MPNGVAAAIAAAPLNEEPATPIDGFCDLGSVHCLTPMARSVPRYAATASSVSRRHGTEGKVRHELLPRRFVGSPIRCVRKRGDGDELALIEAGKRGVDQIVRLHDDLARQIVERAARHVPEVGRGRAGQDGLDAHVLVGQFLVKRLAQGEHEGFRRAIDAVQDFRRDGDHRADVDDRAAAAGDERRSRGIGEPRQRRDVEVDHLLHGVDVGLQKRLERADTRIVDQHRDAGIGGEDRLDSLQIRLVVEVGGDGFDGAAGRAGDAVGHLVQPRLVARDEDEVVAAACQPVGIDRADSCGGSCHDCDAFGGGRHGSFSCSVAPAARGFSSTVFLGALDLPNTYAPEAGNARYAL